jgi:hypothetical protein
VLRVAGSDLIGRLIPFAPSGLMEFRNQNGARGVGFAPGYCVSRFQRGAECARHHGLATAPKNACKPRAVPYLLMLRLPLGSYLNVGCLSFSISRPRPG